MPRALRCLLPTLVAMALVWTWMALTVRYSYGGNWTGLFCTGEFLPPPSALANERIYIFPQSYGYDGQAYHYIAHDPFFQKGFAANIDAPRLRCRRALISLIAWGASLGNDTRIDAALIGVVIAFTGLGVYWIARLAILSGYSSWAGLLLLLAAPVLISIDRILTDGALAAFCVAFVLYWRENRYVALWLVCAFAGLTRETGMALASAMSFYFLVQALLLRRGTLSQDLSRSAWFALSVLPTLGWAWFCALHTASEKFDWLGLIPFESLIWRLVTPSVYPLSQPIALACTALDFVGLVGIVIALWDIGKRLRARAVDPPALALYQYALLAMFLNRHDSWGEVYGFGRILAPMLVVLAVDEIDKRPLRAAIPALLMLPRIGLQCGRQILNVVRGLAFGA